MSTIRSTDGMERKRVVVLCWLRMLQCEEWKRSLIPSIHLPDV
jgi:hypothetical protein